MPAEREKEMKRILGILAGIILTGLIVVSAVSLAQQPQTDTGVNVMVQGERVFQGPEGPPPPPGDTFVFVSSESFEGKPVKGAPYSAQAVTESTQTLGDGNRIVNKVTSSLYRDSEGRTRREQTLKHIGGFENSGEPIQTIFINDPVARVSYALDSRSHVAHKSTPFRIELAVPPGAPGTPLPAGPGGEKFVRVEPGSGDRTYLRTQTAPLPGPPLPGAVGPGPDGERFNLKTEEGIATTFVFSRDKGTDANVVRESLGKQVIEGVEADGTRTTRTIPAGQIGNDRPIEIVNERWYSPELQIVVMTRHSDPRLGETIYRLTNISRTEPAKALFEVPGGYTIKEGMLAPGVPPARMRKPANPDER